MMGKDNTKSAVIYLRVSGKSQIQDNKHGFRRQKDACHLFAKKRGIVIGVEYYEKAISGVTSLEQRPAFQEMLTELLGNGCRTIIVESLDRLAREYRIQEQILIYLSTKGLSLIAANTGEDVTQAIQEDPMKKALIQIQGIFSELDKSQLVRKLRKSREALRNEGKRVEGVRPYGHFPEEKPVLAMMKSLRRKPRMGKRRSYAQVAHILNQDGHRNRAGNKWTASNVWSILRK